MWRTDSLEETLMLGKIEGSRRTGDDRGWDGWMASPTRWTSEQALEVGDGQRSLACSSHGVAELDTTEWLNWLIGLYSLWNFPGQNTGVYSCSLLQGIFPTQGSNPSFPHFRWILYQLSHQGSPRILEWVAYSSPVDLPDPGIKPGFPAFQVDSLPAELPGKPNLYERYGKF